MKEVQVTVNQYPVNLQPNFLIVFKYLLNTQLKQLGISSTCVIANNLFNGKITLNCESAYDEIRVEQLVYNAIRTLNKFSSDNTSSAGLRDTIVLLSKNCHSKNEISYYRTLRELFDAKYYPPASMQEAINLKLKAQVEEDKQAKIQESLERLGHLKETSLATGTWLWQNIIMKKSDESLARAIALLCESLTILGIKSVEELNVLTKNVTKNVMFIGTPDFYRIATQQEVENAAKIKNIFTRKASVYSILEDKYLTLAASLLLTRNLNSAVHIVDILNSQNCTIPFSIRFKNINKLTELAQSNVQQSLLVPILEKIVNDDIDTIVNILTTINLKAEHLIPYWRSSVAEVEYPFNMDAVQVYYEQQNVDIDTLDALLSIEPEEGDVKKMLQAIKKFGVHCSYDELPYDIATKALKKKNYVLSAKQLAIVEKKYASIMRSVDMAKNVDAEECVAIATELDVNYKNKLNDTVKSIISSTLRYRICTERQLEVLRNALVGLKATETAQKQQVIVGAPVGGTMFALPTNNTTAKTKEETFEEPDDTEEVDPVNVKAVTARATTDAYKAAYGGAGQNVSDTSDSIWTE